MVSLLTRLFFFFYPFCVFLFFFFYFFFFLRSLSFSCLIICSTSKRSRDAFTLWFSYTGWTPKTIKKIIIMEMNKNNDLHKYFSFLLEFTVSFTLRCSHFKVVRQIFFFFIFFFFSSCLNIWVKCAILFFRVFPSQILFAYVFQSARTHLLENPTTKSLCDRSNRKQK